MGQPPPPGLCRLFGPVNFSHNFPLDDRTSASSLPIFQGEMVLPEVITLAKSLEGCEEERMKCLVRHHMTDNVVCWSQRCRKNPKMQQTFPQLVDSSSNFRAG
ncbi:hypothetical protein TGME49_313677 [Toxoplasma gondii ME49]|uniref:Uncharacterized protein n=2 Tax=Toxoplasma gondii TaxID=5811 RepID=A0A125YQ39_TOXGV|nr:hypothetical protein TGME49_313677 [Toxoplasma gondii ME49]EPT25892.1 hypothetical protein TGME49_313677 [Toxoplasma gondii ME49]ESS35162.1 hypothetical protein TGVEG_313677 [Toxoplasma gondii VEG]|eukprot:XP_018635407.1 hypothetical protein TGME49_313677 [Toxoplasma gondii ME49]